VHKGVRSVRGIAECLPYCDETFDVVMCQGAMDHFADAALFFGEAARVLKPGGRLVVAVANYESFSCTIGERFHRFVSRFGVKTPAKYKFWRIPEDHTFKGSYRFMKGLAKGRLELVRLHGASMFLFLPPWWKLLEALSFRSAKAVFRAIDRIAYRLPVAADVVIGVWQKPAEAEPVSWRVALAEWRRQSSAVPSYLGRR
jgi:SAM-dependent methyltransferase